MILCCPPWRSVQGSAFRALLCSLVLLTMLVLCACACVLLCLCACSLVLLTMLLLRACACGWGGGEGTSPSRLITANERTPWRSILASRNLQYALSCCTHTLIICNIMLYTAQHPALCLNRLGAGFGGAAFLSASTQQPLTRTMFTLGRRPAMLYFNLFTRMVTESLTSCRSFQKWCLYLDTYGSWGI